MTRKIILFLSIFVFTFAAFGLAERDFRSKNGQVIRGTIEKYFEDGDVLLKRSKDLQLFRINLDIFTEDDQAFVKNNFPPNHDALDKRNFQRPLHPKSLMANAKYIDSLIETKLRSYNQRPNKLADDETFLRRTYLKIIGRIPSYSETKSFLSMRGADKRSKLVDSLLLTEGYVSHWFHFWADILRAKDNLGNRMSGVPFVDYIREFVAMNRPYDEWVKEMLSSSGPYWEQGNGGVGYFLRDAGMQLDNMSNTVRIFLGTSLECAQCHDHPFDRWTQKQFYEMAAYTEGAGNLRRRGAENLNDLNRMARTEQRRLEQMEQPRQARQVRDAARDISDLVQVGLESMGRGKINLPNDYQYDNARPGAELKAKTIFGLATELDSNFQAKGSRASYANWVASESNPRFTTVIVNRLWKEVFGLALIEPLDNMFDDTMATHPELQLHLEKVMVALDYDIKEFLRILYNTQTFQRMSPAREVMSRDAKDTVMPPEVLWVVAGPYPQDPTRNSVPYFYQGPMIERMSGEQIWDSLVTLAYPDVDNRKRRKPHGGYDNFVKYTAMTGDELFAEVMRRTGIDPNAQAAPRPANNAPKMELNAKQKGSMEVVMKYADLYCMSCHDSGKSRGDIDIQQYHDNPGKLAGNASMLKMFTAALEKKEMPPSNRQLQPTVQERAEMVAALNSLVSEAPANAAPMQGDAMAMKLGEPINTDCPIKPGRAIDPTLLALNEDGETVGFCCNSCLNQHKRNMAAKANPSTPSSTSSASTVNYVRDAGSVRASELSSPAPNGHLIREFGGSDREQIENSHKQASVTQVLNLLNGYVEDRILKKKDALVLNNVKNAGSKDSQIDTAFLSILNRKPTSKEKGSIKTSLKDSGDNFYKDIVWVLVNSHEFLFVQ
ncbi:MAG: DUF1549 domain-containing protein [Opitutales bacterium]|nr:DUF1549 domain-containing protein [Opitutales bacterium]